MFWAIRPGAHFGYLARKQLLRILKRAIERVVWKQGQDYLLHEELYCSILEEGYII